MITPNRNKQTALCRGKMRNSQLQLILIFESDLFGGWHKCSKPIIAPSEMRPKHSLVIYVKIKSCSIH